MGQKPFECRGGNRGPNESLDDGDFGGIKGMQIGVGFPLFKQLSLSRFLSGMMRL